VLCARCVTGTCTSLADSAILPPREALARFQCPMTLFLTPF
jgi:hypothetical protein